MASQYRKIDPRLWKDEKFIRLAPLDKLIVTYALTAQSNRIGLFVFSLALAAEELNVTREDLRERFVHVCKFFGWIYDEPTRVLYLPTWWKYNRPDNPNQLKGCMGDLHDIPDTALFQRFSHNTEHLPASLLPIFRACLGQAPHSDTQTSDLFQNDIPNADIPKPEDIAPPEFRDSAEWREAWQQYAAVRAEKGEPMTPTEIRLKMRDMERMGLARAIAALRNSAASGYKKLVEPKPENREPTTPAKPSRKSNTSGAF